MKKKFSGLLRLASLLLIFGLVLAVAGWAMGGETSMTVNLLGREVNVGLRGRPFGGGMWTGEYENAIVEENLAAFDKLDVDLSMGDVDIVPSDHFGVDLSWHGEDYELHYTNEGGHLKVWSTSVPNIGIDLNMNCGGKVTVYLPQGVALKSAVIKVNMGSVAMDTFSADTLDVWANLGDVSLTNAIVKNGTLGLDLGDLDMGTVNADKLELTVSMGTLSAYELVMTQRLTIVDNMGDVDVNGALGGETQITAHMGDVTVATDLPKGDYGYDLDTSMGGVRVNGEERDSAAKEKGGPNSITIDNSMGDIDLDFN